MLPLCGWQRRASQHSCLSVCPSDASQSASLHGLGPHRRASNLLVRKQAPPRQAVASDHRLRVLDRTVLLPICGCRRLQRHPPHATPVKCHVLITAECCCHVLAPGHSLASDLGNRGGVRIEQARLGSCCPAWLGCVSGQLSHKWTTLSGHLTGRHLKQRRDRRNACRRDNLIRAVDFWITNYQASQRRTVD